MKQGLIRLRSTYDTFLKGIFKLNYGYSLIDLSSNFYSWKLFCHWKKQSVSSR